MSDDAAKLAERWERLGVVCTQCRTEGWPVRRSEGNVGVLLLLLLLCVLPGLAYMTWMIIGTKDRCGSCGSTAIVLRNTPAGRQLRGVA